MISFYQQLQSHPLILDRERQLKLWVLISKMINLVGRLKDRRQSPSFKRRVAEITAKNGFQYSVNDQEISYLLLDIQELLDELEKELDEQEREDIEITMQQISEALARSSPRMSRVLGVTPPSQTQI